LFGLDKIKLSKETEMICRTSIWKTGNVTKSALALLLCGMLVWTGCSTAWVGQAEEIVAALIPAAANIVALVAALQGQSVSAADLQLIQTAGAQAGSDLQIIQSLITAYQTADAAAQPGILNQIESAINAVQANFQGLLPALHIKDATTQAKITAVVGIVLSEVQSLAAIVPLVKAGAPTAQMSAPANISQPHPKIPLTANEFVASFNSTLTAKTGNAALDRATAGLRIHRHGKVSGWLARGC
jgi:hypothetical protein